MPNPVTTGPITNSDGTKTTTRTTFHSNGSIKSVDKVTQRPDGKIVKREKETFKKGTGPGAAGIGTKKTSSVSNTDHNARPPKRVIVAIKYCPDGTTEKVRITRVYYKPENRWHEEKREKKTVRRKCKTGEIIAMVFPQAPGDFVLIAAVAAILIFTVLGWTRSDNIYWLIAIISAVAVTLLYHKHQVTRREEEVSLYSEIYDAMLDTDDDEIPDFVTEALEEENPSTQ